MNHFHEDNRRNYIAPKILLSLLMSLIFFLVYTADLFSYASWAMQDAIFQREKAPSEEIVVIGVTSDDLDTYGMWPWDRTTWANVLATINGDAETQPAVIGLAVPFYGSSQPISDEMLTNEVLRGNVILACTGEFSTDLAARQQSGGIDGNLQVTNVTYPFLYPTEGIQLGHTNILYDNDGILRRALLELETEQGGVINSMAYQAFQMYHTYHGQEANFSPELDENGFWYVDYTAADGAYFQYSISDILHGNYDQSSLTGKIVLIGLYDTTLMDYYRSAIDHTENMYGIEFTANCVNAMLNGAEIQVVGSDVELIILMVATFVITFLALYLAFATVSILVVLMAILGLGITLFIYGQGILYPPFFMLVALITCYILAVAFNYWFEWYSKRHVTNVFKQYVDPKVMEKLIQSNLSTLHAEGSTCDIAVLFVDLRGFTHISERLQAEEVVQLLNQFLSMADGCIKQHGGTLDKFIGDCAMAFWGAPEVVADPAYHACCCGMSMVEQTKELNRKMQELLGVRIAIGVGVHYGQAVVGNIGSETRLDYTAIGDTVNTASRLESVAPPGYIYVSDIVVEQVGDRAKFNRLPESLKLKGKAEPMTVYRLEAVDMMEAQ